MVQGYSLGAKYSLTLGSKFHLFALAVLSSCDIKLEFQLELFSVRSRNCENGCKESSFATRSQEKNRKKKKKKEKKKEKKEEKKKK